MQATPGVRYYCKEEQVAIFMQSYCYRECIACGRYSLPRASLIYCLRRVMVAVTSSMSLAHDYSILFDIRRSQERKSVDNLRTNHFFCVRV